MNEEKKNASVTPVSWNNPSIGSTSNSGLNEKVNENSKEINELKNEINSLKEQVSKLTGSEVKEETNNAAPIEEKVEEVNDLPFASPFTESNDEVKEESVSEENDDAVKDILETVKEEVKEEIKPEEPETVSIPVFEDMLDEPDRISVVVNRYNTDIEATTSGKGAKYISLTDAEHSKLLSGKINE